MVTGLAHFCADDSGAATVEWVVLTAATVGLGLAVLVPFGLAEGSTVRTLANYILAIPVGATD